MSQYLSYFIDGRDQFLTLGAVLLLWLGLAGIGAVITGERREYEATPLYGWAVAVVLLTFSGVLSPIPFTYVAWLLAAIALPATVIAYRRHGGLLAAGSLKVFILALPLILIASAMVASQWDEFSHWLPAPRFLLQYDAFPSRDYPVTGSPMLPAYPYSWPFLTYLTSRFAGQMVEGTGRLINVLMLMSLGLVAIKLAFEGAGRKMPEKPGWTLCALALMTGTLLNPTFVQKIVLTSYADTPTAVLVAFSAYVSWRLLEVLSSEDDSQAWLLAWQFALLALVLINIKQVNLVLVVVILAGAMLVGLRDPQIRFVRLLKLLPLMALPALVLYGLWRYHIAVEAPGEEATFKPFDQWNIAVIPLIIKQMLVIAAKKGAHFAIQFIAVGFAIRALFRFHGSFDRLAVLVATAFLGYNAFMLLVYVGSFSEPDALRAVSFWRYNMQLGLMSVVFGAYGVGILWHRFAEERTVPVWLRTAPVVLIVAATMMFPHKLRFDLEPPKPRFNGVAFYATEAVPMDKKLIVLDPTGTGESSVITRARTNRPDIPYRASGTLNTVASIRELLIKAPQDGYVIVHSTTPKSNQVLGLELKSDLSYLIVRNNSGGWKVLHTWDKDGRMVSAAAPRTK